jgi:predicted NUDIX family phosphoesterase
MSTINVEQVMVVKTELFHQCGYFQGFCDQPDLYLEKLLDAGNTLYLPRDQMELDPRYKQLIPYCIFRYLDGNEDYQIFQYRRGSGQGESRLHKKKSIGIGGHISSVDAGDHSPYLLGMQRELDEEVTIGSPFEQKLVGLINDDQNEVGKVHLGVVHIYTVTEPAVSANESEIIDAGFLPIQEILDQIDEFETWSQICLRALFG